MADEIKLYFWCDNSSAVVHFSNSKLTEKYKEWIPGFSGSHGSYTGVSSVITDDETLILPENLNYLFQGCTLLTEIDVSNWDTSNVTNMGQSFMECRNLKNLDLSSWDVNKLQRTTQMFQQCEKLESINLQGWHPDNLLYTDAMFYICSELTHIITDPNTNWNTGKVIDSTQMFNWSEKLPNYKQMFGQSISKAHSDGDDDGCFESIHYLYFWADVDNEDLHFSNTKINENYKEWVPGERGSFVEYKNNIRRVVTDSDTLILPWDASYMFYNCSYTEILDLSNWNVRYVTDFSNMFGNEQYLECVDLSGWVIGHAQNMDRMFYEDTYLSDIIVNKNTKWIVGSDVSSTNMFKNCKLLPHFNGDVVDISKAYTDDDKQGYFINNSISLYYWYDSANRYVYFSNTKENENYKKWLPGEVKDSKYGEYRDAINVKAVGDSIVLPQSIRGLFYECTSLNYIYVDTWDTSNVLDMRNVFFGSSLKKIDLSQWDISNVYSTEGMFSDCDDLEEIDLYGWVIPDGLIVDYMFSYDRSLQHVYVHDDVDWRDSIRYREDDYTPYHHMFYSTPNIHNFDDTMDLSKAYAKGDGHGYFEVISRLYYSYNNNILHLSNRQINNSYLLWISGEYGSFTDYTRATRLIIDDEVLYMPEDISYIFCLCTQLQDVDVSKCETSDVKNTSHSFYETFLTSIDLSNWNTSSLTNIDSMFANCFKLAHVRVSNWDTRNVISMINTFNKCYDLEYIDLQNWEITGTNTSSMFGDCNKLKNIVVKNDIDWRDNLTQSSSMFRGCVNLPNWNGIDDGSKAYAEDDYLGYFSLPKNWIVGNYIYVFANNNWELSDTQYKICKIDTSSISEKVFICTN